MMLCCRVAFILAVIVSCSSSNAERWSESSDEICHQEKLGSVLLQRATSRRSGRFDILTDYFSGSDEAPPPGDDAEAEQAVATTPLTEEGFTTVSAQCCLLSFELYARRIIESLNLEICDEGCFNGFIPFFDCGKVKTLEEFSLHITKKSEEHCACFKPVGECPSGGLPRDCLEANTGQYNPAHHRRRVCQKTSVTTTGRATTTTTVTTATTTTTSTANTIRESQIKPKDVFIAIDASYSVKDVGWDRQTKFMTDLVQGILGNGNPDGHRVNAHWFNGVTKPITPTARIAAAGGVNSNQPGKNGANDIGTFMTDSAALIRRIGAVKYRKIRYKSTDVPQVLLTAAEFWKQPANNDAAREKITILISDTETHNGEGCGNKLPNNAAVYAVTGNCNADRTHPCRRTGNDKSCDRAKCICGLYYAEQYKNAGHTLALVATRNLHHDTTFEKQMRQMASDDSLYFSDDSNSLPRLLAKING